MDGRQEGKGRAVSGVAASILPMSGHRTAGANVARHDMDKG